MLGAEHPFLNFIGVTNSEYDLNVSRFPSVPLVDELLEDWMERFRLEEGSVILSQKGQRGIRSMRCEALGWGNVFRL